MGMVLGRFLLAFIFMASGFSKIVHFADTAALLGEHGIPLSKVAVVLTVLIEMGGSLLLITGFYVRYAALIMALFLVPVTLMFHRFWVMPNPEHDIQMLNFLKNVSIFGGLLVTAFSSGVASSSPRSGG